MMPLTGGSTPVPLRPAATVMRLARLGSFHRSRLSFMRTLLRRIGGEGWSFDRPIFSLDDNGVGVAVYAAHGPQRSYSLVCFAHDLAPELRSDRVIAQAWDATFTLHDGTPTPADIERLSANVPKQEAGRVTSRELTVSRANRSVRLFEHVVDCLASGRQPERQRIEEVGYVMRTTAVYGSGKLGAADRESIAPRPEFAAPFQAEMLTVYLIRAFTLDLVEHLARVRAPDNAVTLAPDLRRVIGVGNSTGLGMAPFLLNHPVLLNNWILARETALARVRSLPRASAGEVAIFADVLDRAIDNANEWHSVHSLQIQKVAMLKTDLSLLATQVAGGALDQDSPWDALYRWAESSLSLEGQEQLVSLLLEPHASLVDELAQCMSDDDAAAFLIDGGASLDALRSTIEDVYDWALSVDWTSNDSVARVWYISQEKLEPRLGQRFDEPVAAYEQPLAPGRDAAMLYHDVVAWRGEPTVAAFLREHPQHRHMVRRAQIAARFPYAEIRDNTTSAALLPIDILRCKLAFFGATHFDPRSDRWVRINMFANAPLPEELTAGDAGDTRLGRAPRPASRRAHAVV